MRCAMGYRQYQQNEHILRGYLRCFYDGSLANSFALLCTLCLALATNLQISAQAWQLLQLLVFDDRTIYEVTQDYQ